MLRRNITDDYRYLFLAKWAVAVTISWALLALVAACVPIPTDPTSVQTVSADPTTNRAIQTDSTKDGVTETEPPTDRDVLVALYHATSGDNWVKNDNWMSEAPVDKWYGVVATGNDRVIELMLPENGLSGSIPPELGNLINLRTLDFRDN
ncbi:MAG: hypothetical protein OXJ55_08720, partial [Caldilineaceae bacterium]|nr:hypothetical protein [Caldilineaceae bacterium]